MDLGIPMKVELQSDSSAAHSLTERLGAGPRTNHIDTRILWVQERVQDGGLSIKKVPSAKKVQMLERSQSLLQYHKSTAHLQDWYSTDHGSHSPRQDDGTSVRCTVENVNRQSSQLVVNIETGAELSETIGPVEVLTISHDMNRPRREKRKRKRKRERERKRKERKERKEATNEQ